MERAISSSEANQRFSEMLRDVQGGDTFVVTSRGRPVAKVIPIDDDLAAQARRSEALMQRLATLSPATIEPWNREDLYE